VCRAQFWIDLVREHCKDPLVQIVLVGNKTDLDERRQVGVFPLNETMWFTTCCEVSRSPLGIYMAPYMCLDFHSNGSVVGS